MSKDDENQYIKNIALLCRVTIFEQKRVPREDITKEEETLSSESDHEPELNENENSHPVPISKKLKSKQQTGNKEIVIQEHITRSGRVTSVKVPVGLQRDGTQIPKSTRSRTNLSVCNFLRIFMRLSSMIIFFLSIFHYLSVPRICIAL